MEEEVKEAKEEANGAACRVCGRAYKTLSGRWKHEAKEHGGPPLKEYNCGWDGCNHTTYGAARQCRWRMRVRAKERK
jgi:hypothetical protein